VADEGGAATGFLWAFQLLLAVCASNSKILLPLTVTLGSSLKGSTPLKGDQLFQLPFSSRD
jgi:hypothetical protein